LRNLLSDNWLLKVPRLIVKICRSGGGRKHGKVLRAC
jgi:hypothetical protein